MNDNDDTVSANDIDEIMNEEFENVRQTAFKNAKIALEETFVVGSGKEVVDIGKSRFLEQQIIKKSFEQPKSNSKYTSTFWKNIRKSLERPKYNPLKKRLQTLAGIIDEMVVSVLTLPTGVRVEFTELPPWYDVVKYKICGFKYESLDL